MSFPVEGLIRIMKGTYPAQLMPKPQSGQLLLDIGCGDGGNFVLYNQLGLDAVGLEVSDEICASTYARLKSFNIQPMAMLSGCCSNIPAEDGVFDYAVSWNSCYYMSIGTGEFEDHVREMARVLKPRGWLICSIPTWECFIFKGSTPFEGDDRYRIIGDEYFGMRKGEIMRCFFSGGIEIIEEFSPHFCDFSFSRINIDWFGLKYDWHVFTAMKKS